MERFKKTVGGNDIFKVLSIRPFLLMMLSELFSQLAFNIQNFALILIVYKLTHSNTAVSGIILSFTIPAILFSIIGGVYVDRWNKKHVMFNVNILRAFLLLPFLIPNLNIGLVYILTFLIAVSTQFFIPAEASIIPTLVPQNLILSANSVFSMGIYGAIFAGYVLAGPLLLLIHRENTFILLSILFFASALFIYLIKIPFGKKAAAGAGAEDSVGISFTKEMKELFSFIKKTKKVMHAFLILTIAQAIVYMLAVLGPGYLSTILRVRIETLSLILIAPAAIGIGVGALILGSPRIKKYKFKHLSALGFLLSGIVFILLPFGNRIASHFLVQAVNNFLPHVLMINNLHIVILLAAIIGFSFSFIYIPSNTTLQLETNEGMRGRIFGLLNALIGAVSFLPVVLAGGLADLLGVGVVIISVGILMICLGLAFYIFD